MVRIDPTTSAIIATIPLDVIDLLCESSVAAGEGAVWTMNEGDGTVSRIDPATDPVTATIPVATRPVQGGDIAVGGGFVWARVSDQLVAQIDPTTNAVVARYGPPAGSGSVAADDAATWVSAHDVNAVWRLPLP